MLTLENLKSFQTLFDVFGPHAGEIWKKKKRKEKRIVLSELYKIIFSFFGKNWLTNFEEVSVKKKASKKERKKVFVEDYHLPVFQTGVTRLKVAQNMADLFFFT